MVLESSKIVGRMQLGDQTSGSVLPLSNRRHDNRFSAFDVHLQQIHARKCGFIKHVRDREGADLNFGDTIVRFDNRMAVFTVTPKETHLTAPIRYRAIYQHAAVLK